MTNEALAGQFLRDAIDGLSARPPALPSKYLYDARGSELFEAICRTDDYYVTRADLALHEAHLPEISRLIGADAHIIEFGSGAGIKTRKLLASLERPRAYTPIEISAAALAASAAALRKAFPDIDIRPLQADYTRPVPEHEMRLQPPPGRRVIYFPGSTIGNFDRDQAIGFLDRMRRIAGDGGAVLIGVDLLKPVDILVRAYDDRDGITAQFNINILNRLKDELNAEVEIDAFRHEARFNDDFNRIEMHLVAARPTAVVLDGHRFAFAAGDSIHTESSHKYTLADFRRLASRAGLTSRHVWQDPEGLFSMHWLEPDA